jgi:hypothetical protein
LVKRGECVTTRKSSTRLGLIAIAIALALSACGAQPTADSRLDDEAMVRAKRAGLSAEDVAYRYYYPDYIDNYFAGMDAIAVLRSAGTAPNAPIDQFDTPVYQLMDKKAPGRVEKLDPIRLPSVVIDKSKRQLCHDTGQPDACEVLGRNTWMMWAGGNEGFWDWIGRQYGFLDFVRLLDTREAGDPNASKKNDRAGRFARGGMINEPGMGPSLDEDGNVFERALGLRIDEPLDKDVREWRRKYVAKALGLDGMGGAPAKAEPGSGYGGSSNYGGSSSYGGVLRGNAVGYPNGKSYDSRIPPPEIYGLSSGVVGLRLFPNPNFDKEALERWLKTKDSYASNPVGDPRLERPFRVGMSCAFCHASFHPLNPPADVANPKWENISGNIGAQYLRMSTVFGNLLQKDSFVYHILDSQPPGTVDTSLIASDNINNPNTMNSVFNLAQRVLVSLRNPKEHLADTSASLPSVWGQAEKGYPDAGPPADLTKLIGEYWKAVYAKEGEPSQAEQPELDKAVAQELREINDQTRRVPRILLDGSDSIGAWGALARVYLNIGTNWEQWDTLHDPIVGLTPQKPFTIDNAERHSAYWAATKLRVGPLRDYFLRVSPSMPLVAAALPVDSASPDSIPDLAGQRGLVDQTKLKQGREVFARNCIACHSSIQPPSRHEQMAKDTGQMGGKAGDEFFDHDPGQWMRDPRHKDYQDWALRAVELPEFWRANYLSTDYRVPVNYVKTNSCRAMATNALTGNMWQDFASDSYRRLPSIGDISFFNPYGEKTPDDNAVFSPRHKTKDAPQGGGGPGFYRVPTLVSIWATGPYLHNNSLGTFTGDPSIKGRLEAFDDGIAKLLWKEKRTETVSYGVKPEQLTADHGLIWRTPQPTYLSIPGIYLPEILRGHSAVVRDFLARYPELRAIPQAYRPLPTAALLLVAFLVLWFARSHWVRRLGYLSIVLGFVVGGVIYFLAGGLGGLTIGPIPKGTPVGLLANVNPDADPKVLEQSLATIRDAFTEIGPTNADEKRQQEIMKTRVAPALLAVSKCPDLVMDRGHYFPWFADMTDSDKKALIELLKTF